MEQRFNLFRYLRVYSLLVAFFMPLSIWGYEFELACVLLFQNEAQHLKEWIEYHRLMGVEHFFLYNNLSEDNYLEILEPYIERGEIELFQVPDRTLNQPDNLRMQCRVYNEALRAARGRAKWVAFIDGDEYLVPLEHDNLTCFLEEYEAFGGVHASWLVFGTSNVQKIPSGRLRIETLVHCDVAPAKLGKSIVRPERVKKCTDPHVFLYMPTYFHVNANFTRFGWESIPTRERLLVFHYYTGDLDHFTNIKYPRRKLWYTHLNLETYLRDIERYNRKYNPTMLQHVEQVKYMMEPHG